MENENKAIPEEDDKINSDALREKIDLILSEISKAKGVMKELRVLFALCGMVEVKTSMDISDDILNSLTGKMMRLTQELDSEIEN